MDTATQLISGYTAYTNAEELGASATGEAPATTPTTVSIFLTASSPECAAFSVTAVSASVGATIGWSC